MRVLYVEDEALLAISAANALEDKGYEVELAFDGEAGLERARRFAPHVILTDYMMPRMNGVEMARMLRNEGFSGPIILITAIPQRELSAEGLASVTTYLEKPVDENVLTDVVEEAGRH